MNNFEKYFINNDPIVISSDEEDASQPSKVSAICDEVIFISSDEDQPPYRSLNKVKRSIASSNRLKSDDQPPCSHSNLKPKSSKTNKGFSFCSNKKTACFSFNENKLSKVLMPYFKVNKYPGELKKQIALETGLTVKVVSDWFQTQREKEFELNNPAFARQIRGEKHLEKVLNKTKFPNNEEIFNLMLTTGMTYKEIKYWFNKRRRRIKEFFKANSDAEAREIKIFSDEVGIEFEEMKRTFLCMKNNFGELIKQEFENEKRNLLKKLSDAEKNQKLPKTSLIPITNPVDMSLKSHYVKKARLNEFQKQLLENFFNHTPYPKSHEIDALAQQSGLEKRKVRNKFYNFRLNYGDEPIPKWAFQKSPICIADQSN